MAATLFAKEAALSTSLQWSWSLETLDSNANVLPKRLPGHPQNSLMPENLLPFLETELTALLVGEFYPWIWLAATQDSTQISSLINQIVRGRDIVPMESPELHLAWHYKQGFIK